DAVRRAAPLPRAPRQPGAGAGRGRGVRLHRAPAVGGLCGPGRACRDRALRGRPRRRTGRAHRHARRRPAGLHLRRAALRRAHHAQGAADRRGAVPHRRHPRVHQGDRRPGGEGPHRVPGQGPGVRPGDGRGRAARRPGGAARGHHRAAAQEGEGAGGELRHRPRGRRRL
ncbi:MAG: FIG00828264: hypothetical protein, partial [uncultured Frankineae bacterium]